MIQIRTNTFETNSSSVHTLTICSPADYDSWENGELYYFVDWGRGYRTVDVNRKHVEIDNPFVTAEEAAALDSDFPYPPIEENAWGYDTYFKTDDGRIRDMVFLTKDEYDKTVYYYMTSFVEHLTTPKGEDIVAFGYAGHD